MRYYYKVYLDNKICMNECYRSDKEYNVGDKLTKLLYEGSELEVIERIEVNEVNDKNVLITAKLYCAIV